MGTIGFLRFPLTKKRATSRNACPGLEIRGRVVEERGKKNTSILERKEAVGGLQLESVRPSEFILFFSSGVVPRSGGRRGYNGLSAPPLSHPQKHTPKFTRRDSVPLLWSAEQNGLRFRGGWAFSFFVSRRAVFPRRRWRRPPSAPVKNAQAAPSHLNPGP